MGLAKAIKAPAKIEALLQGYIALEQVYYALDQGQAELEQATGRPICIDSCGKCCQVTTPVISDIEAHYIISTMVVMPGFNSIINRALDWLVFKHQGISSNGNRNLLQKNVDLLSSKQCPFLDDGMRCTIYGVRPLVCRAYGISINADEWCPRPLHWTEAPNKRMTVGKNTNMGRRLSGLLNNLHISYCGFLPHLVARLAVPKKFKDLAASGKVADAKLAIGKSKPDLFHNAIG